MGIGFFHGLPVHDGLPPYTTILELTITIPRTFLFVSIQLMLTSVYVCLTVARNVVCSSTTRVIQTGTRLEFSSVPRRGLTRLPQQCFVSHRVVKKWRTDLHNSHHQLCMHHSVRNQREGNIEVESDVTGLPSTPLCSHHG